MARKTAADEGSGKLSLVVTLVVVGAIAVFLGYLMGQYAINMLAPPVPRPQKSTLDTDISRTLDRAVSRPPESVVSPGSVPVGGASGISGESKDDAGSAAGNETGTVQPAESRNTGSAATVLYRVQVGAFGSEDNANKLAARLKSDGYPVLVTSGPPYRVQVGAFSQRSNAEALSSELKAKGYETIVTE